MEVEGILKTKKQKKGEADQTLSCITLKIFKLTFLCDHIIVWSRFHSYICACGALANAFTYTRHSLPTGLHNTTILDCVCYD